MENQVAVSSGAATSTAPVLVLGNGLSRLLFDREIREYEGEVWGCNFVYREYPEKITRLSGHVTNLEEAAKWLKDPGNHIAFMDGNLGKGPDYFKPYACPPEFRKDAGTTLVAEALHEGRSRIDVCGFDLGGPDVGSPRHWRIGKQGWIIRWKRIYQYYQDRWTVVFWGMNHLPMITSTDGKLTHLYDGHYRHLEPHIEGDRYLALHYALYGLPAAYDLVSRDDDIIVTWTAPPHEGKRMVMKRWLAKIEAHRDHCIINEEIIPEEKLQKLARVEAMINEVVESIGQPSIDLMAEKHGLGDLSGLSRREQLAAIGAADKE